MNQAIAILSSCCRYYVEVLHFGTMAGDSSKLFSLSVSHSLFRLACASRGLGGRGLRFRVWEDLWVQGCHFPHRADSSDSGNLSPSTAKAAISLGFLEGIYKGSINPNSRRHQPRTQKAPENPEGSPSTFSPTRHSPAIRNPKET